MSNIDFDNLTEREKTIHANGQEKGYKRAADYYKGRKSHGRDFEADELATLLGEFVNGSHRQGPRVGKAVLRDHRTIQRNIFCLCLDIIEAFADTPLDGNHVDLRNEASVKMAKDICSERGYYKGSRPPLV